MRKTRRFYCAALLLMFVAMPSFLFCQDVPVVPADSLSQYQNDSIDKAQLKIANEQRRNTGQDTIPMLPQVTDTTQKESRREMANRSGTKRRFYWEASKYPTGDSSLAAKKWRRHSPLYAALFSAALPGLGQAYNKKYWKIPIVYAGLGGLGYALYYTASNFTGYRNAYRAQVATVPDPFASYKGVDDQATLKSYRDYFKRSLDVTAICTGVFYLLNIVDAAVDAHLFDWNMKDDIHLSWQPTVQTGYYHAAAAPGVRLSLSF